MRRKYPRTPHLSWSESISEDDTIGEDIFLGTTVVITEKLDGENTSLYNDYYHAHSINSGSHPSRDYVKGLWGSIKDQIPKDFRICGENMFAKHSLHYTNLESYFLVFSIWDGDVCLSWKDTVDYCKLLNLVTVPVLYEGLYDKNKLPTIDPLKQEGYVIRSSNSFEYDDFVNNVRKYVRKGHVQTDEHWLNKPIEKNLLRQ
jgi:hypothetical protein